MWDEAVGDSLAALKLIPDWFVTSKMIKNLLASLYADENMIYFDEDSGNVPTGINNGTGILNKDFNNINLDNNFEEDGPDTIILIRLFAWQIKFEKRKALKKMISEELMLIAWHPESYWNFCILEEEKKEIELTLTEWCF